jgi:AraC-like DNA-binding protein
MPDIDLEFDACDFDCTVARRSIARLQVSHVTAKGSHTLRRTPAVIARCAQRRFVLIRMRAGQGWLRHRGGELPLSDDECVLLDDHEPYELRFIDDSDSLWFHLPIDWVESYLPDPQVAIAVPLGSRPPWTGMLREVLDTIHADQGAPSAFLIARSLCTALALTVDAIEVRSTAHSRKTFNSLQRTLAELAPTCNVTVAQIAQAHGISLRYLHAVYSANGTSCGRELIRVRLERAQRLLLDPAGPNRSIDDIAWQCGFSDAAHFRRRFRELFGVPPSAMRTDPARLASASRVS